MSADDIEKGTRWRSGLASELEQSSVGIICLTRENLDSTWIHFEAGALSKQQQNTYVCTFLFGLEPTDVREPLTQFQATRAQKEDVRKLISTINNTLSSKLSESELNEIFEVWWPKLEQRLAGIGEPTPTAAPIRPDWELLEEILGRVRALAALRPKPGTLAEIEAEYVSEVLAATKGNKTEAAQILGISRRNLHERIARFSHLIEPVVAEINEATSEEDKPKDNPNENSNS